MKKSHARRRAVIRQAARAAGLPPAPEGARCTNDREPTPQDRQRIETGCAPEFAVSDPARQSARRHSSVLARIIDRLREINEGINGTPPPRAPRSDCQPLITLAAARLLAAGTIATGLARAGAAARGRLQAYAASIDLPIMSPVSEDDRRAFALLALPLVAMIVAVGTVQNVRPGRGAVDQAAFTVGAASSDQRRDRKRHKVRAAPAPAVLSDVAPPRLPDAAPEFQATALPPVTVALTSTAPTMLVGARSAALLVSQPAPMVGTATAPILPGTSMGPTRLDLVAAAGPVLPLPTEMPPLAALPPASDLSSATAIPPAPPILFAAFDASGPIGGVGAMTRVRCEAPADLHLSMAERARETQLPTVPAREAFGAMLAAAARSQIEDLVVYDDRYRRISYPMGDVSPLYGVCTDVVIRAYRAIGIDLQQAVQASGLGRGDTNIDHRRTDTLRRFFARFGESLPASTIPEDYQPGDIVTYYRPQNTSSRSHIAIVSDVLAPSGRFMIVHNRGWGPQLEDGLFVDEITGHYRYSGSGPPVRPADGPILAGRNRRLDALTTASARSTGRRHLDIPPPVTAPVTATDGSRGRALPIAADGALSAAGPASRPARAARTASCVGISDPKRSGRCGGRGIVKAQRSDGQPVRGLGR